MQYPLKDHNMVTVDTFYKKLKSSILAKDNATSEEVAIWLDIEGLCNVENIIRIFKCIDTNYHTSYDMTTDAKNMWRQMTSILLNSMYGACSAPPTIVQFTSNIILKNLFILMFQTHFIDSIVLDEKLMRFANKMMFTYGNPHSPGKFSQLNIDKFEIWAELHDRLEERRRSK